MYYNSATRSTSLNATIGLGYSSQRACETPRRESGRGQLMSVSRPVRSDAMRLTRGRGSTSAEAFGGDGSWVKLWKEVEFPLVRACDTVSLQGVQRSR